MDEFVVHRGGCHCGAVRFEVIAPPVVQIYECNCSVCTKKQLRCVIIPANRFKIVKGEDNLSTYTFNTHVAKHTFCKTCGVQSFYTPRSNPDGIGVAVCCIEPGTITQIITESFDGQNWENSMKTSDIKKHSK